MSALLLVVTVAMASLAASAQVSRDRGGPAAGIPAPGLSPIEVLRASNGALIPAPEVETLDCKGIRRVLKAIDDSGYRGTNTLAEGHPDMPIFIYEDKLTVAQFERCSGDDGLPSSPTPAFSGAFARD